MQPIRSSIPALIGALTVAVVPFVPRLSIWVMLWCAGAWGYTLFAVLTGRALPGKTTRRLLTLAGVALVAAAYGVVFDRHSAVSLLWVMASIKPMEVRTHRDVMVTVFLAYFLAAAALFFSNDLGVGLYVLGAVFCTTAVLIHVNHGLGGWSADLGLALKILLQALPLMLVLFVFFPRFHSGLWGFRNPADAVSGFSDQLSPGSMSNLVRNDAIVFRVEFSVPVPEPALRYWRGLTFWRFDGRSWRRRTWTPSLQYPAHGQPSSDYVVSLEPHNKRWLFALDLPVSSGSAVDMFQDHTLAARRSVRQRIRYRVNSITRADTGVFWEWERAALQLPATGNPGARTLAQQWRSAARSPEDVIRKALAYFKENGFVYTLNPPLLGANPVDEFLLETRRGYCEHYASAFAFLMRAAAIPARVVGGYLGGDVNPFGNYLIVRQSHAHTWVEVWLGSGGWRRVDPTSAIVPQRAEQGVAEALPPVERLELQPLVRLGLLGAGIGRIRLGWDALNNNWNNWVLDYSHARQQSLLVRFGMDTATLKGVAKAVFAGTLMVGLFVFLYVVRMHRLPVSHPDAVQQAYTVFCARLARIGFGRRPDQGPLDFARHVTAARRDLAGEVIGIVDLYIRLRYGRGGGRRDLRRLRRRVRRFRPQGSR